MTHADRPYKLGVDIGGTFTDGVLIDETSGEIFIDKVPTTSGDPSEGFIHVVDRLLKRRRVRPQDVRQIIHATTIATNAVIERRGARTGFLTTTGFRDILEIARQVRYDLYDLQTQKPPALVPRERCFEIPERVDYRGEILVPLDEEAAEREVRTLLSHAVDSVAVCFLHAYQNPAHELRLAEIIRDLAPDVTVSLSSDVAPEIREYWRASTTVINAYIAPLVTRYIRAIQAKLTQRQMHSKLHLMQSNGGVTYADAARSRPVHLVESGPAAGVAVAAYFADLTGTKDLISFDMGGTTAKMGLILDGRPVISSEFEVGAGAWSGSALVKGSGYPILGTVVDLVEVGAGGGSIAWIDSGGVMRVGPQSAGADPGPACYGRGGSQPTIADANLVLGRLNPAYFLGGEIELASDLAWKAIETHCARTLEIETAATAMGIVDIADANMVQGISLVSVQRGYDPREFTLFAFGGAGPLHANSLAAELEIPVLIVPPSPGVASALGMLVSDLRHDYRVTRRQRLTEADCTDLEAMFRRLETEGSRIFAAHGTVPDELVGGRFLELRYVGQSWQLQIPIASDHLTQSGLEQIRESFDRHHKQSYGYSVPEEAVEIVNIGVSLTCAVAKPRPREVGTGGKSPGQARKGSRDVYFRHAGFVSCPIFDRYALRRGNEITGPAVIEEPDSTTVIHPEYVAEVEHYGAVVIRRSS